MNLKKIMLCALIAVSAPCIQAYESNYLKVRTTKGTTLYDLNDVDRISFTASQMNVSQKNGKSTDSFNRDELKSMGVTEISSGLSVATEESKSKLNYDAASKTVTIAEACDFEIYSTDGKLIYAIPDVKAGEKIILSEIHPGIVIIKAGSESLKLAL